MKDKRQKKREEIMDSEVWSSRRVRGRVGVRRAVR